MATIIALNKEQIKDVIFAISMAGFGVLLVTFAGHIARVTCRIRRSGFKFMSFGKTDGGKLVNEGRDFGQIRLLGFMSLGIGILLLIGAFVF